MRLTVSLIALALLGGTAGAGEPYEPIALAPADILTPHANMLMAAAELRQAAEARDFEALAAGIADSVTWVDGALEMGIARHVETLGPWADSAAKLTDLAYSTGGDVRQSSDPEDTTPYAQMAAADYILVALAEEGLIWGTDPLQPGAICTYGWRDYDVAAAAALAERLDIFSSAYFYVTKAAPVYAVADEGAAETALLQPDQLYALDYDADARSPWIGMHLPDGGTAFISFDLADLRKPYASGICFAETEQGWRMVGQTSTSL